MTSINYNCGVFCFRLVCAVAISIPSALAFGQDSPGIRGGSDRLELGTMRVGDKGEFAETNWTVHEILGRQELLLNLDYMIQTVQGSELRNARRVRNEWRRVREALVVRGVPTAGLVSGRRFPLEGVFRVAATEQLGSGKTVFIVEPETQEERRARLTQERLVQERQEKVRLARGKRAGELRAKEEALARGEQERAAVRKAEATASGKFKLAQLFLPDQPSFAIKRLQDIVKDYPDTVAAQKARDLLKELRK